MADEVAGSITSFIRDEALAERQLVGALAVSLAATGDELADQLLVDQRLLSDPPRLVSVVHLLPQMSETQARTVYSAVGAAIAEGRVEPLTEALADLPGEAAANLLSSGEVDEGLRVFLAAAEQPDERDWLVRQIYEASAGEDGAPLREAIHDFLINHELAPALLREHADLVFAGKEEVDRDWDALDALGWTPLEDRTFWVQRVSDGAKTTSSHGKLAGRFLRRVWGEVPTVDDQAAVEEILAAARRAIPFVAAAEQAVKQGVLEVIGDDLGTRAWWVSPDQRQRQAASHEFARELISADSAFADTVADVLVADLGRAPLEAELISLEVLTGYREIGAPLGKFALGLSDSLADVSLADVPALATELTRTRLALLRSLAAAGVAVGADAIEIDDVVRSAGAGGAPSYALIADWLALGPGPSAVRRVLVELGEARPKAVVEELDGWAQATDADNRTELATLLARVDRPAEWIGTVAQDGIDDLAVVEAIVTEIQAAGRAARRQDMAVALTSAAPVDPAAQRRVADIIIELLETGKQGDFKAAVKAIGGLGEEHRSATRLRTAFRDAAEEHDHVLSERAGSQLAQSGVRVPRKAVKKSAWETVKGLFG